MALFQKGIYWTRWLAVCIVSVVFNWFGWTMPHWTEAYQPQGTVFNSKKAVEQDGIFREQLNKESARGMMSTYHSKALAQVSQPRQGMKVEEPGRAPISLFDEAVEKIRQPPQAFPKVETQAFPKVETQAFPKVETQAFPKVETQAFPKVETQAFPKVETQAFPKVERGIIPQPTQAFPKVEMNK